MNNTINTIDNTSGLGKVLKTLKQTAIAAKRRASAVSTSVTIAAVLALFSTTAFGNLNTWYDLADFAGADADVKMTSFASPGTTYAVIEINNYSRYYPVYVQVKPVADFALDGDWKRATQNTRGTYGTLRTYWNDRAYLAYNAFAYRICRDIPDQADPCGAAKTIYPYR